MWPAEGESAAGQLPTWAGAPGARVPRRQGTSTSSHGSFSGRDSSFSGRDSTQGRDQLTMFDCVAVGDGSPLATCATAPKALRIPSGEQR
jgi:hypothetical protein